MVKGGYTPRVFKPNGGIDKTRPRNALRRAPACFNFNSVPPWQDARSPCRARAPFLFTFIVYFFRHVIGANGTVVGAGRIQRIPPFDHMLGGGVCPRNSAKFV